MTCRNSQDGVETGGMVVASGMSSGGALEPGPSDTRLGGGVNPDQALLRNAGTCRPDVKGEAQPGFPNKPAGAVCGGWIIGRRAGTDSVLDRVSPSFVCRCTWGEFGRAGVQLSRVLGLSSSQTWALPPDKAAGGRLRDAVRAAAGDHPAGPHASARII